MKWVQILWQLTRDVGLTGLGGWVIYKQVYAPVPNPLLLGVALTCIAPAARSAVIAILSGPGSSSESPAPAAEHAPSSPPGGGGDERA